MSARLIKRGESADVLSFAPFVQSQEQDCASLPGTVKPFVPRAVSELPPLPTAQAESAGASNDDRATETRNFTLEAERLTANAKLEAERLLAAAQSRVAQLENEARERGLAEVRARAEAELAQRVEPLRQQLTQTIAEVAELRAEITDRAERDLVKLAIEIAKKVVHREVTMDSEVALTLARVALARIHNRAQAVVHLHPEDFAYVTKHQDRLGSNSSIELVEDRAVSRGGCLIETEMGDTDARIEQQFAELERSFLGV